MFDTLTINAPRFEPLKTTAKDVDVCDNGQKAVESTTNKIDHLELELESERLKTFTNWKSDAVTPKALAEAGFYFLDRNDLVKCAFCKVEINRWESGDDPMEEHARWSSNCPFVKQNRKLPPIFTPLPAGQDVCGGRELFPNSVPEKQTFKLLKKIIRSHEDLKSRLETFADWPKSLKQKPARLAEAGFYYKGVGDQVICFECGGGLKDWEDSDDPWEQHALWFDKCPFLLAEKGQGFIDEVHRKLKTESTKEAVPIAAAPPSAAPEQQQSEEQKCKICFNNSIETVFIPCGHLMACVECSLALKDVCPLCRKRIEATMRVFPS